MKKQVIENFSEWIFEAAAPKKPAAPAVPAGYVKTTLPAGAKQLLTNEEVLKAKGWKALADTDILQLSAPKPLVPDLQATKLRISTKRVAV